MVIICILPLGFGSGDTILVFVRGRGMLLIDRVSHGGFFWCTT